MARRRYLVAYDISEPQRLRTVHHTVKSFGYALQYSVFICDLDPAEKVALRRELRAVINHRQDKVVIIDLGDSARSPTAFEFLGLTPQLPTTGPRIV